ncbi:hypothetical protein DFH28DRAFT_1084438 [Melampsora americana]|nr:hypothetical protein DFH28DRAFT_1084438 [Melampsora americana]
MTDPDKTTPYQRTGFDFSRGASGLENLEVATYSLAHALAIGFWGSVPLQPQIDVGVQIVTQARKQSPIGSVFASVALTAMENLVHCSDEEKDPTQLTGHLLDPGAYDTSKDLHMHDLQWTSFQMILNMLFEQPLWPIFNCKRAREASSGVLSQNITCQFLVFCSICEGIRNGEKVMTIFLKATKLSTVAKSKDLGEIINAFDKTIDMASEHKLFLLEGLACEILCNYIEKCRLRASRLAYGYQLSAYRAYQNWGALKKCQDMRRKHEFRLPKSTEYSPVALSVTTDLSVPDLAKKTSPDMKERSEKTMVAHPISPHLGFEGTPDIPITSIATEQSTENFSHPSSISQRAFDSAEATKQNFDVAALLAASHTWQT